MRITILEGLSQDLVDRLAEFNTGFDEFESALSRVEAGRAKILNDVETTTVAELRRRLDEIQQSQLDLAQRKLIIARKRAELIQSVFGEQVARLEPLEAAAAKIERAVRKKLIAAGSGPESMIGWRHNRQAAERQFAFTVTQNVEVRSAMDGTKAVQSLVNSLRRQVANTDKDVLEAAGELDTVAMVLLGLPRHQPQQNQRSGPMFV